MCAAVLLIAPARLAVAQATSTGAKQPPGTATTPQVAESQETPRDWTLPVPSEPRQSRTFTFADLTEIGAESNENWDAVQDATGRVYIANGRGVLVYDGASWTVIRTPRATAVRSLAVGPGNRVFAGAQGEFGYLLPDSTSYQFVSLSDEVVDGSVQFGNVWTTRADGDKVYFQAPNHLFVWDGEDLTTVYSEASYHTSFLTNQGLILRERGVGLVRYEDGATQLIPNGEFFAEMRVFVLEQRGNGWLIGTRDNGFYTYHAGEITPFATAADELFSEYWLYNGIQAENGELILGTLGAGLIGMDSQGRVTSRVTEESGLPDPYITSLTAIRPSGFLATTQNNGIYFFEPAGVSSAWADLKLEAASHVTIFDDTLFVSSGHGLETTRIDRPRAKTHLPFDKTTYQVAVAGGALYIGTDDGVQIWRDGKHVSTVLEDKQVMALAAYKDGVAAGHRDGLAVVSGTTVRHEHAAEDVRSIAVVGRDIWYATLSSGLMRLTDRGRGWDLKQFSSADGLPADDRLEVVSIGDDIRVYADDKGGIYKMAGGWFALDEELTPPYESGVQEVWNLVSGPDGTLWIGHPDRITRAVPGPLGYTLHESPALTFERLRHEQLFAHDDGSLWYNRGGRVVRYSPDVDGEIYGGFEVILREVRTRRDNHLAYSGLGVTKSGAVATAGAGMDPIVLPFAQNALTASLSTVYPAFEGTIKYAWSLNGSPWSEWTNQETILIEDLWEGSYTLRVKAQDEHRFESSVLTFRFEVLPPFYRTMLAYLLYAAIILGLGWFTYQYRVMVQAQKEAARQAIQLEQEKVYRRKLETANTRLKQANKLKDEFLAKTSHELRTPITAILGFTNILRDEIPSDKPYREFLDIIQQSGDRLMGTLDDLLELAELRAGTRQFNPQPTNLVSLVDEITTPLKHRAGEKGIYLRMKDLSQRGISTDVSAFRKVYWNLLDNAVKFTESGGISVSVTVIDECPCVTSGDACIEIVVQDTGIGIDERFIPHLFDEFLQESEGESRSHNGTGLGLTIVGGLVDLMGGEIEVESEKRVGSTFKVRIPVGTLETVGGAIVEGDGASPEASDDRPPARRDREPKPGTGETA